MKQKRAWIVLNSNGNPVCGVAESIFDDKKFALHMAQTWMDVAKPKNPNAALTVHRVTIDLAPSPIEKCANPGPHCRCFICNVSYP